MHYALKPIPRAADARGMSCPSPAEVRRSVDARLAAAVAARYRLVIDADPGAGVLVRCVEVPAIACTGAALDDALAAARRRLADHLCAALSRGQAPPVPRAESESPLGAWADDLDVGPVDLAADPAITPAPADVLRRMADADVPRYRVIIEQSDAGHTAIVAEFPDLIATGPDSAAAVGAVRWHLANRLFDLLSANRLPPEPLRDTERRPRAPLARVA